MLQPRPHSPDAAPAGTSLPQAWDGGLRGVSFAHGPGIVPGKRVDGLTHAIDWLPTIISFAGYGNFDIILVHLSQKNVFRSSLPPGTRRGMCVLPRAKAYRMLIGAL